MCCLPSTHCISTYWIFKDCILTDYIFDSFSPQTSMDAATTEQMAEFQFNPGMVNSSITIINIIIPGMNNTITIAKTTKSPYIQLLCQKTVSSTRCQTFTWRGMSWFGKGKSGRRKLSQLLHFAQERVRHQLHCDHLWCGGRDGRWRGKLTKMTYLSVSNLWNDISSTKVVLYLLRGSSYSDIHTAVNKSNRRCKRSSDKGRTLSLSVYCVG